VAANFTSDAGGFEFLADLGDLGIVRGKEQEFHGVVVEQLG